MILVDTSVWIEFLRKGDSKLKSLLEEGSVATHSLVIGELTCGNISKRTKFLSLINALPKTQEATHDEVINFIEKHSLYGKGIGFFDLHLLCSSILSNVPLWTFDKRLDKYAGIFQS